MKQIYLLTAGLTLTIGINAQTTSTLDEIPLTPSTYNNGSDLSGGFNSGNAFFPNSYDTSWGGYWAGGWSISNIYDTVTQPSDFFSQLYSAKEVIPATGDSNFAVGTQSSRVILTGAAQGKVVNGFHITNSTYTYNSMRLGDGFAKKFGGTSGTDPDYFKLVVKNYHGGVLQPDSVVFFLADYTFSSSSMDYIVDQWTWVDLTSLGNTDSLEFTLRSTDVGSFGINTPLYYVIDNFTTADSPSAIAETNPACVSVYPNPFADFIFIASSDANVVSNLYDAGGKLVMTKTFMHNTQLNVSALAKGMYTLQVNGISYKLVK